MTFTHHAKRRLSAWSALGCVLTWLPVGASAQADDQTALWRVVEQLFAAIEREDLTRVMALWSQRSPDLAANRQSMQETFATYRKIEVKGLRPGTITVDADTALIQVVAELSLLKGQAGASATPRQASRTIQMRRESGAWKVWSYSTAEEEFAAVLSAIKTPEEGVAVLGTHSELVTADLVRALVKQVKGLRAKPGQALLVCDLALSVAQRLGDKGGTAVGLRLKGDIYRGRGDYKQAREYYDQSFALAGELGDQVILGEVLTSLGILHAMQAQLGLTRFGRQFRYAITGVLRAAA
jgi:hypothetical protein